MSVRAKLLLEFAVWLLGCILIGTAPNVHSALGSLLVMMLAWYVVIG